MAKQANPIDDGERWLEGARKGKTVVQGTEVDGKVTMAGPMV